jgi:3-keto-disaccharide hydrolase
MKASSFGWAAALALAACAQMRSSGSATNANGSAGSGWQTLVDGESGLANWNAVGDANWRVEGGAIVADHGKGGYLVSKQSYQDFEIRAEFYAEAETNSGVYIRCSDPQKLSSESCYEVNIWDVRPDPKYGTGAIVNVAAVPVPLVDKAGGKWNTYEITAKGQQLTVKLNGVQTATGQDTKHAAGPFALQYGAGLNGAEGGPIKWRKVQIRPL